MPDVYVIVKRADNLPRTVWSSRKSIHNMARNTSTVYLGFEDEPINEKNRHFVDYTTNKVGGQPVSRMESVDNSTTPNRGANKLEQRECVCVLVCVCVDVYACVDYLSQDMTTNVSRQKGHISFVNSAPVRVQNSDRSHVKPIMPYNKITTHTFI